MNALLYTVGSNEVLHMYSTLSYGELYFKNSHATTHADLLLLNINTILINVLYLDANKEMCKNPKLLMLFVFTGH